MDEFIQLSWILLEAKLQYYHPELVHASHGADYIFSDQIYDAMESDYKRLAGELGQPPSVTDAVGFPLHTPSGRLVANKLKNKKGCKLEELLK
jgi:hypothetical protein